MKKTDLLNTVVKIAVSIAKKQITNVIGNDALDIVAEEFIELAGEKVKGKIETIFSSRLVAEELQRAIHQANVRFQKDCKIPALNGVFDMEFGELPSIQKAIKELPKKLDHEDLALTIQLVLERDHPILTQQQIRQGVELYLLCLDQALLTIKDFTIDIIGKTVFRILKELRDTRKEVTAANEKQIELLERIDRLVSSSSEISAAFSALHQLPPPPADFTGRNQEIDQLLNDIANGKNTVIIGLTGMGGVGKTALGLFVAHKITGNYPDAQIFIDLKGTGKYPLSTIDVMKYVILSFEPRMDLGSLGEDKIKALYRGILDSKKALLFLDNALDTAQVKLLLPPAHCAFFVTSRRQIALPGLKFHHLDIMTDEETHRFLLELCPRIGDQASKLGKLCGHLPIALRIAGNFLATYPDWSPEEYILQLADQKNRLSLLKSTDDPELNVEVVFSLSYNQLSVEDQSRWRKLAIFPSSFQGDAAAEVWDIKEGAEKVFLSELRRYNLVEFDNETQRYTLHDLGAAFAETKLTIEEKQEAAFYHSYHYLKVLSKGNMFYKQGDEMMLRGLELIGIEWQNIQTGHAWAVNHRDEFELANELCANYPSAGANILDLRLPKSEWIKWLNIQLLACRSYDDKLGEKGALGNLGLAYGFIGNLQKAIEYHEQALEISRELGDRQGEGDGLCNLGLAYLGVGATQIALIHLGPALEIYREIGNRCGEGVALNNLASAYYNRGDIGKSQECLEQVLIISRETGDQRLEGQVLGNLGRVITQKGNARKAIEYLKKELVIDRKIGDYPAEGAALGSIGIAYNMLGDKNKSLNCFEKQMVIARETNDRIGEGQALNNFGNFYMLQGDTQKSINYNKQALVIAREIGNRLFEGQILGNMGVAYSALGYKKRAQKLLQQSFRILMGASAFQDAQWVRHHLDELEKVETSHN